MSNEVTILLAVLWYLTGLSALLYGDIRFNTSHDVGTFSGAVVGPFAWVLVVACLLPEWASAWRLRR